MAEDGLIYWKEGCGNASRKWAFWDIHNVNNASRPVFPYCFQWTVVAWAPTVILLLAFPFYIINLHRFSTLPGRIGCIAKARVIVCGCLYIPLLIGLAKISSDKLNGRVDHPPVVIATPVILILTTLLAQFVIFYENTKGVHSSGVMLVYWLLKIICDIIPLASIINEFDTTIELPKDSDVWINFVILMVLFIFCCLIHVIELVLTLVTDKSVFRRQDWDANLRAKSKASPKYSKVEDIDVKDEVNNSTEIEGVTRQCPWYHASFLSRATFFWITPFIIKGYKTALVFSDLCLLRTSDKTKYANDKCEKIWRKKLQKSKKVIVKYKKSGSLLDGHVSVSKSGTRVIKGKPSILRMFAGAFGAKYAMAGLFKLLYDICIFIQPQLLGLLINFVMDNTVMLWQGAVYAIVLFLVGILKSIFIQLHYDNCTITGMKVRTSTVAGVYRKALKLSPGSRKFATAGYISNLMSVDSQNFQDAAMFLHYAWSAPLIIIVSVVFLWFILGPATIGGIVVLLFLIPMNTIIARIVRSYKIRQLNLKDSRVKLMNEVLTGIKVLKLYGWEPSFEEKIEAIRKEEIKTLRGMAYVKSIHTTVVYFMPYMVSLVSFAAYVLSSPDNILDANKAFVSMSWFNVLNQPMTLIPSLVTSIIQAGVSIKRLGDFFACEEIDLKSISHVKTEEIAIKVSNASFKWAADNPIFLKGINMEIKRRQLVAIVGSVGAGKSSLVNAILGELHLEEGTVNVDGKIAYVPQQAWIQHKTVRDNIIFGKKFKQDKYDRVVEACALTSDFLILPEGDLTEVGDKGLNVSGGQKQRISLARAVYQNSDIYIFDDPLSAVDSHVGKHIFDKVIGKDGMLNNKTRILVTHGIHFLPFTDEIFILRRGEIYDQGPYDFMMSKQGLFAQFMRNYLVEIDDEDDKEKDPEVASIHEKILRQISVLSNDDDVDTLRALRKERARKRTISLTRQFSQLEKDEVELNENLKKKKLTSEEQVETGSANSKVYVAYGKAIGLVCAIVIMICFVLYCGLSAGTNIWLSIWSNDPPPQNGTQDRGLVDLRLGVYGALGVGQALATMGLVVGIALGTVRASSVLHAAVIGGLMRAPMSFFDTTPLGRIINRISKDMDVVDVFLPMTINLWSFTASIVFGTFVIMIYNSVIFIAVIVPLIVIYFVIQRLYIRTSRQLKRIESVTRSPLFSHFDESVTGASSIRAYRQQDRFIERLDELSDANNMSFFLNVSSFRWLGIWLDMIGNLLILSVGIMAVAGRGTIDGGMAGLAISYALRVTGALMIMVRVSSDMESFLVSVERIEEYTRIESEAPWRIADTKPADEWPKKGKIQFRDYATRYRKGLDLVVKNINVTINPGQKVGIVGRTGAGKSSLTLALFRLIESAAGHIVIDNVEVSSIGLHDLRTKLTIIPQDPVLFAGSLRMNLDPFDQYSDEAVWKSLELSNLKAFVESEAAGLSMECHEGGENLSVGQRQLLCLARALLKKTSILILDEATAAVDLVTDDLIQHTIRTEFNDCTVVTIAHRLKTILDYDRILVLDQGEVKEFDSPQILLANNETIFYGMANSAGLV